MLRPRLTLALAVLLVAGCHGGGTPVMPRASVAALPSSAPVAGGNGLIGHDGASLIGHDGASLVALDAGSLIGHDGASLIGHDGASIAGSVTAPSLIGHDGASAVSEMTGMYRLEALDSVPLAGYHVYLRTADGRYVTDAKGQLVTAVTDAQGHYSIAGYEPQAGLVVVVALGADHGTLGALVRILTRDRAPGASADVDLASTLAGTYVLDRYVGTLPMASRAAALDRLPDALDFDVRTQTQRVLDAGKPTGLASLKPQDIDTTVDALRKLDGGMDRGLENVRLAIAAGSDASAALTAAGQTALQRPIALAPGPEGETYVAEELGGIVRRVAPDGTSTQLLGHGGRTFPPAEALLVTPDGLLLASPTGNVVVALSFDGQTLTTVLGGGQGEPGARGTEVAARSPGSLARAADGTLYVGETDPKYNGHNRILALAPDQSTSDVTGQLPAAITTPIFTGLAVAPDGALWALEYSSGSLLRRPAGGAWQVLAGHLGLLRSSGLVIQPDGSALVAEGKAQRLRRFDATGAAADFAGKGQAGNEDGAAASAGFNEPGGLALRPDGTLLVADVANALVRTVKDGTVATLAGTRADLEVGEAQALPLNVPGAVAIDPQGRVVLAEVGSGTIKRLEASGLVTLAGVGTGYAGDGGPATAARFEGITSMVYRGAELFISDNHNHCIRRIDAQGIVTTVLGGPDGPGRRQPRAAVMIADEAELAHLSGLAVSPAGELVIADGGQVYRWTGDNKLVLVAGSFDAGAKDQEGVPATSSPLSGIAGLAYDSKGSLYIAEFTNMRVRKVTPDGLITTVAGQGLAASLLNVESGAAAAEPAEQDAKAATLLVPAGLAVDKNDALYIAEAGTRAILGLNNAGPTDADLSARLVQLPQLDGRLRKLTPDGRLHLLAGLGAPAANGHVVAPAGIAIDGQGRLVFSDVGTNQIKVLAP